MAIFATTLGIAVSIIAFPQMVIFMLLFIFSKSILPLMTPTILADFIASGGILTIAAGLRISKIKFIPLINMLPALILVILLSHLWNMLG